jgi:IS30 family transposase
VSKPISKQVQNLAYDDCSEFVDHTINDETFGPTRYFTDPYSSWQGGTNDNQNGPLRQYIPKYNPLSTATNDDLAKIGRLLKTGLLRQPG